MIPCLRRIPSPFPDSQPSFDFKEDAIIYDLQVSTSPAFANDTPVVNQQALSTTEVKHPQLPPGRYYIKVIIHDMQNPAEHWMTSLDDSFDRQTDQTFYGVKAFTVP